MVKFASGSKVALAFARCAMNDPGNVPDGFVTPVADIGALDALDVGQDIDYSRFYVWGTDFEDDLEYRWGMLIRTTGFSNAQNNGYWRIIEINDYNPTGHSGETQNLIICHSYPDPTAQESVDSLGEDPTYRVQIAMEKLRATGRNINLEKNVLESAEVDPDRYKKDVRHGFNRVVGSIGYQLSCQDFRCMIRSCIGASSFRLITIDAPVDYTFGTGATGTGTITKSSSGTPDTFYEDGLRAGDIIRVANANTSAHDGDWLVLEVDGYEITLYDPNDTIISDPSDSGAVVSFPGRRGNQSINLQTFFMERQFTDTGHYQVFDGCVVDSMTLSISPEAIIGGTMNVIGMSARDWTTASIIDSYPYSGIANSSDNPPLAAFEGIVFEGGALIAVVTGIELTIANNRSLNPVVGSRYSPTVFDGTCNPTGTLTCYFENSDMVQKFVSETDSSIWVKMEEPGNPTNFISLVLTKIKYTGGTIDPPNEGPVTLEMPFVALGVYGQASPTVGGYHTCLTFQDSSLKY